MSAWQRLNAPRNKREKRVAKIARDLERERIIALLTATYGENYVEMGVVGQVIALIKGEGE